MDMVMLYPPDERINVLAPVVRGRKGRVQARARRAARPRIHPRAHRRQFVALDEQITLDRRRNHTIDDPRRPADRQGRHRAPAVRSIDLALRTADDIVVINTLDGGDRLFSRGWRARTAASAFPR
jgi:excinuclease ABC subunit A